MNRTATARLVLVLVAAVAVALVASGCSGLRPQPAAELTTTASAGTEISRMTAAKKRSAIATSFPIEVPVPQGRVTRGEAQGGEVWDYQLEIPASAADVASWYTTWYGKAEWRLIADAVAGAGRRLTFTKGGAASEVTVEPKASDLTNVTVVVGVGTPVLNTQ